MFVTVCVKIHIVEVEVHLYMNVWVKVMLLKLVGRLVSALCLVMQWCVPPG